MPDIATQIPACSAFSGKRKPRKRCGADEVLKVSFCKNQKSKISSSERYLSHVAQTLVAESWNQLSCVSVEGLNVKCLENATEPAGPCSPIVATGGLPSRRSDMRAARPEGRKVRD
eukprot:GHVU01103140.1.p1 GENE.GHVU01103140.1~~GHVU01103140.1.p1  ORF type:complete len:116 (-),score=3.53 GHVU01103140.1:2605-2952(-)